MVYAIYEEFFPEVEKKLQRVAKKCVKHGNDFTFEIKGEEIKVVEDNFYKFILVEVDGVARMENWECIAVLEVYDSGNIIRRINTEIEVPEKFRTTKNICEHCNSKRQRNNLYIIHNTETDEWKQVGGNCLREYTDGLDMEYVVAFINGITELEEYDGFIGSGGKRYYRVKDILEFAVEIIAKTGYFGTNSPIPTKSLVSWLVNNKMEKAIKEINKDLKSRGYDVKFKDSDFYKDETEELVEKIIEHWLSLEDNSEFTHNVQVMLKEGYVLPKSFGYLCYLPEGYANYLKKEKLRIERQSKTKSDYFGQVGKRYKEIPIHSVNLLTTWETQWGVTHVYKITLTDGSILIWKSSTGLYLEDNQDFDSITFTVKDYNDYKGEKQTEVTRCKVAFKNKSRD